MPLILSACGAPQLPRATIYNSSEAGVIYALNAQNGSVRWQYHTVDTVFGAGLARPTLLNGTLYAATSSGGLFVYALNAQDGTVRWKVNVNNIPTPPEQPVIVNDILYLEASRLDPDTVTVVYALRIQDGSVLWHYQTPGYLTTRKLTVAAGLVYLALGGPAPSPLLALDAATGALKWQASLPGLATSAPAVAGGLVILSDSDGSVQALQTETGALVWSYPLETPGEVSTLTAANDLVYVGGTDGTLVALQASDGAVRWRIHLAHAALPVVAQGILYAVPVEGDQPLYALHANDGSTIWQYQSFDHYCLAGVAVTIAADVLYCLGADYSLMLIDARSGLLIQRYDLPTNLLTDYPAVVSPEE
jgi:outer membrane protein assembly factor BamB